jgi:hypothetical protein
MPENAMTPAKATALRKPFPPETIGKLPKSNVLLDYVGHAAVTDRLLTVDPEWTWEPFALDAAGLPAPDAQGNLWIRLTICGVTRIGVGDGKSAKERIGDAIRNAAMRFGVALDLWAKEDLVEFAQAAQANAKPVTPSGPGAALLVELEALPEATAGLVQQNWPQGYGPAASLTGEQCDAVREVVRTALAANMEGSA